MERDPSSSPHPSRSALGPIQPPAEEVPGLFPGVKQPGRGADHPLPSNLYSSALPPWNVTQGDLCPSLDQFIYGKRFLA